ncbi:hypothetical protein FA13DRAFT_1350854 [Coprinellus micaceus]|uniref:Uncharacterized protein n=1 Tax=Coprinellus micaceus TaxID=71717 RepID=A0A4Y7TPL4_COPMI|nr:hypothetical protein FA13DRAFT_1350854 [Coprinellus micaceus]
MQGRKEVVFGRQGKPCVILLYGLAVEIVSSSTLSSMQHESTAQRIAVCRGASILAYSPSFQCSYVHTWRRRPRPILWVAKDLAHCRHPNELGCGGIWRYRMQQVTTMVRSGPLVRLSMGADHELHKLSACLGQRTEALVSWVSQDSPERTESLIRKGERCRVE